MVKKMVKKLKNQEKLAEKIKRERNQALISMILHRGSLL